MFYIVNDESALEDNVGFHLLTSAAIRSALGHQLRGRAKVRDKAWKFASRARCFTSPPLRGYAGFRQRSGI